MIDKKIKSLPPEDRKLFVSQLILWGCLHAGIRSGGARLRPFQFFIYPVRYGIRRLRDINRQAAERADNLHRAVPAE